MKRKRKTKITITINPRPARRGHQPRLSGAGKHQDRRTRRRRTRQAQKRWCLKDQGLL